MKNLLIISFLSLCLASCSQKHKANIKTHIHFQERFLTVALDSTTTWHQIIDAADLFADSLSVIAEDTNNLRNRLAAQEWGYRTIYVLSDLYEQKKE